MHSDEIERKLAMHFAMKCLATLALGSPDQYVSRTHCRSTSHIQKTVHRFRDTMTLSVNESC